MANTTPLKEFLGDLPFTAEIDWMLRSKNRPRKDHYNLTRLLKSLPDAVKIVKPFADKAKLHGGQGRSAGKKVLLFATLHYWIEQSAYLGLVLAGMGHDVTLLTLPYSEWHKEKDKFTQRQRVLHTHDALKALSPLVKHVSLLDMQPFARAAHGTLKAVRRDGLPEKILADIREVSLWDAQYTLMREEVDMNDPSDRALYDLRIERNTFAAKAALQYLQMNKPDVVLIPNGLILEMGILFRVARYLGMDAVTYEFNDQREQIWLAQNSSIMQQETDYLVEARCHLPVTEAMFEKVADLENARRGARVWGKSKRLWQYVSSQGAETTRNALGLDSRPVVMLAANVLGDSLTLGRDIFAASMTEWITKTVQYFAKRTDVQLVIRVHPGEKLVPQAKSMATVVKEALPELPNHIHVIGALDSINTYDLIEIADVGLAYTTTVGLETAMNGRPVISCGRTHYRGRGITLDPNSWDEYYATLEKVLGDIPAHQMNEKQIEFAWNYAYRFFFEYPRPFPWRLMNFWDDLAEHPLESVLSDEGMARFKKTFDFLVCEPFTWDD
ncbi:MAG: hypothetical protein DYG85_12800 [Chloroflexi bacterium CFX1]|nr:hypothetical protein [Chloroflexi bacterium CFX1]MCQ3951968.1 hypothetical protein [Chloroflexota bacterium]MDL1919558.1 hypothetical protein [Chloroflexi bacterium CFX5]NUQ58257.1 hypothetical protein [Anaerolineales bacterium]